ncbi:MAG TPA: GAF domain-containing protein [Actinomycetota bacterium]|nr:GAF domain-containing protein [Actinomycetota bacterium]
MRERRTPDPTSHPAGPADEEPGRAERDLEVLARVGRKLLGTVDLDHQLSLALKVAGEALGANRSSVMLLDEATQRLEIRCSQGLPPESITASVALGEGIAGWVAEHNQPFILHGKVSDPRFEGVDPTIDSSLCLPLAVDGRVLGVLNLTRRPGARYTSEDLRLASSIADLASLAVEKAYLYSALRDREQRLTRLLGEAVDAQEVERRRIAGEMSDGFLQALTGLFLQTEISRVGLGQAAAPEAVAALSSIQEAIEHASDELRQVILRVCPSPVGELGLAPSLEAMLSEVCEASAIEGHFDNRSGAARLPAPVETILYRIAQEALHQVVKHAEAHEVWIALERSRDRTRAWVKLSVRDDGHGYPDDPDNAAEQGGIGLGTIRDRVAMAGGSLQLASTQGGSTLEATIPLSGF